jgi:hypothetical protein
MGKNKSASGLINVINYDNFGNISFVSGSTTLMQISSSGAITTTGVISGSSVESSSLAQNSNLLQGTGSVGFTTTGSFATMSSSLSSRTTQIESVYATTGSNSFRANQSITGSLTVTGQIIAQTINVQQVTSSIIYSSGSNVFGCDINSRQTFTGSFYQTGSIAVFNSCVGIGLNNPTNRLEVQSGDIKLNAGASRCTNVFFGITGTNYGKIQYSDIDGSMLITTIGSGAGYDLNLGTQCTTRLTIIGNGNVGIGTTSPDRKLDIACANASDTKLVIRTACGFAGSYSPSLDFHVGGYESTCTTGQIKMCGTNNYSGDMIFSTQLSGTINPLVERMRISCGGNVGIGTSAPLTILDVKQTATGAATVNSAFRDSSTNGNALQIWNGNNEARFRAIYYACPSDQNITFYTITSAGSEGERMRITSNGLVSINNTVASSNYKLGVSGSAYINGANNKGVFITDNATYASIVGLNNAISAYNGLELRASGTDYQIYLSTNGNVGIRASSPRTMLQVTPPSNGETPVLGTATGGVTFTSANTNYGLQFNSTSTGEYFIQSQRFDSSATAYALGLNPVGGYVWLGKGWGASNHRINLEVAQGNNILVVSAYSGASNDSVIIKAASGANPNATTSVMEVTTNSATGRSISAGGTINASGGDYAEYMTKRSDSGCIAKGQIVGIDSCKLLTDKWSLAQSFVVKSTDPSYVGGDSWDKNVGKRPEKTTDITEEEFAPILAEFETKLEEARNKVDRIAFSGQVPVILSGSYNLGDYILPIEGPNDTITGVACSLSSLTLEDYGKTVGRVWGTCLDKAWIAVKIG